MKELQNSHIIHIFAIVHAIIVMLCYALNVRDELVLTVATVTMITLIAVRKNQGIGLIAACVIAGNLLGFVIGTYGAKGLALFISNQAFIHATTSFITTEILGFGLLMIFNSVNAHRNENDIPANRWLPNMQQVIVVITVLLVLRILYSRIFANMLTEDVVNLSLRLLLSNSLAIIVLICCNIIYLIITYRHTGFFSKPWGYILGLTTETIILASISAIIIGYNLPFGTTTPFAEISFMKLCSITMLASLGIYAVIVPLAYVQQTHVKIRHEQEKRHLAQFQYNTLKQQVNPHFLFNCLNILNGLIEENKNREAGEYVRQLASLYRYMLHNENEQVVRLQEELEFIDRYIKLLRVRFPNGFTVEYQIAPTALNKCVVPCSLQMLIENAFKHNVVHPNTPLHITIGCSDDTIWVHNNLQRKSSVSNESTHLGLKNISKQYHDTVGKDIKIIETTDSYNVELPLI
ncbi:MAG: histidine kinase [Alistipes sp.]|nr:histidine kinase [Alistipes sp.]